MSETIALPKMDVMRRGAFKLDDGRDAYLAKASDSFHHVDQLNGDQNVSSEPVFKGSPDEFLASFEDENDRKEINRRLKNKVRKCPECGKAVAFTMLNCNSCAHDLSKTEISFTNNVFTGFSYGVQKGPFPFTISTRFQDENFLAFDDLLALTPCHINIIPTSIYMPDWRFLLRNPARGLELVSKMYDTCCNVLKTQFLSDKQWCQSTFKNANVTFEDLERLLDSGFNYPPSQYQLHLQFLVPPMLPFQYLQYQRGLHFTPRRFFPIQYVRAVLSLNVPYDVNDDTPIEDIIEFYKKLGVDYDVLHAHIYNEADVHHSTLANWQPKQFAGVVVDNGPSTDASFFPFADESCTSIVAKADTSVYAKTIPNADKLIIQNYGRPYTSEGKTTGSYYKNAKRKAAEMENW